MSLMDHHFECDGLLHEHAHPVPESPYRLLVLARIKNKKPVYWIAGTDHVERNAKNALSEAIKKIESMCFYCRTAQATTVDHVVPLSKGGTDAIGNLLAACHECNKRKGAKTLEEFAPPMFQIWQNFRIAALEAAVKAAAIRQKITPPSSPPPPSPGAASGP